MLELISLAKSIGAAGSAGFFALCCAIGAVVATFLPRRSRIARVWFAFVCAVYFVAALPVASYAMANLLPAYAPVWTSDTRKDLDILVVLIGDYPAGSVRETRRMLDPVRPKCVLCQVARGSYAC